jgi:hypothetical protein
VASRGSEVNTLLYSTRLYKGSPSRGSEEERMRIPLLVWSLYTKESCKVLNAKGSERKRREEKRKRARGGEADISGSEAEPGSSARKRREAERVEGRARRMSGESGGRKGFPLQSPPL